MKIRMRAVFFFLAIFPALPLQNGLALSPEQERTAEAVIGNILSPFCPGRMLNDCPTQAASELKTSIRGWAENGQSSEAISERLTRQYGENILASPRAEGMGLLVWVAPGIFILAGGVVLLLWLRTNSAA